MQFSRENERPQAASSGRKTQSVCDGHFKILTYTRTEYPQVQEGLEWSAYRSKNSRSRMVF